MQITVEHKYSIGDIVYVAELLKNDVGINILKYRITGVHIISHYEPSDFKVSYTVAYTVVKLGVGATDVDIVFPEDKLSSTPKDALDEFMDQLCENTYGLV